MWEPGKYTIDTVLAGTVVDGIVHTRFALGIHVDEFNRMAVTHIASGKRLGGSLDARYFSNAMAFVEEVGSITDWAETDIDVKPISKQYHEIRKRHGFL